MLSTLYENISSSELIEKRKSYEELLLKVGSGLIDKKEIESYKNEVSNILSELNFLVAFGNPKKLEADEIFNEIELWEDLLNRYNSALNPHKNFDKMRCLSNIRELLQCNQDVKIGQIEKEAGLQPGYMSRLEKNDNTTDPSVEFIVTASKLFNVSIDTLITVNLTGLTPTEQYIMNFFEKLKLDTSKDKLDWNRETAFNLNRLEPGLNGDVYHPLFEMETFNENNREANRAVFDSKTFGLKTHINGDCFNLRLKNGTTLYLMNIEKSDNKTSEASAFAKEAWVFVPNNGSQLLVASQDDTPIAPLIESLYSIVKERMEHPKINNDVMTAIDAFMKDDIEDDEFELPF